MTYYIVLYHIIDIIDIIDIKDIIDIIYHISYIIFHIYIYTYQYVCVYVRNLNVRTNKAIPARDFQPEAAHNIQPA